MTLRQQHCLAFAMGKLPATSKTQKWGCVAARGIFDVNANSASEVRRSYTMFLLLTVRSPPDIERRPMADFRLPNRVFKNNHTEISSTRLVNARRTNRSRNGSAAFSISTFSFSFHYYSLRVIHPNQQRPAFRLDCTICVLARVKMEGPILHSMSGFPCAVLLSFRLIGVVVST